MGVRALKKPNLLNWYRKLQTGDKIMAAAAFVMTAVFMTAAPTLAWFSYQRKAATMAKINSPAKLSLKSGAGEDIIQFKMSGIDTEKGSYKDFIFCVEGEDISQYNMQLAHTTNINFNYHIYQARADEDYNSAEDSGGVEYVKINRDSVYYIPANNFLQGTYINLSEETYVVGEDTITRKKGTAGYEKPSYDNSDVRQKYAEPVYWQTSSPITADNTLYDEDNEERAFRNYYVLRVSWGSDVKNDKETDMIYITAQVV